jgi:hypothetical protein
MSQRVYKSAKSFRESDILHLLGDTEMLFGLEKKKVSKRSHGESLRHEKPGNEDRRSQKTLWTAWSLTRCSVISILRSSIDPFKIDQNVIESL